MLVAKIANSIFLNWMVPMDAFDPVISSVKRGYILTDCIIAWAAFPRTDPSKRAQAGESLTSTNPSLYRFEYITWSYEGSTESPSWRMSAFVIGPWARNEIAG